MVEKDEEKVGGIVGNGAISAAAQPVQSLPLQLFYLADDGDPRDFF